MAAVGGVRGIVEGVLPALVFVVAFVATDDLAVALVGALLVVVALVVARLIQRGTLLQSLAGFGGVLIGLVWAWRSGEASDYFLWGFVVNAAYLAAFLISLVVRRPLVGLAVGLFTNTLGTWRESPRYRMYVVASWIWVGVFAARLALQIPLYLADDVAWLGTARLMMGVPLFALAAYFTWLLVRAPRTAGSPPATPES